MNEVWIKAITKVVQNMLSKYIDLKSFHVSIEDKDAEGFVITIRVFKRLSEVISNVTTGIIGMIKK